MYQLCEHIHVRCIQTNTLNAPSRSRSQRASTPTTPACGGKASRADEEGQSGEAAAKSKTAQKAQRIRPCDLCSILTVHSMATATATATPEEMDSFQEQLEVRLGLLRAHFCDKYVLLSLRLRC
jgi:hypothetical protein